MTAAAALLFLGLAVLAVIFGITEQRNARESRAREFAAYSSESLSEDPEKSVLLGLQALNATLRFEQPAMPVAEDALHQALLSSLVRLTLRGHSNNVSGVAFCPDGKRLATTSGDKTTKIWDAGTGKELLTLSGHSDFVYSVAFSPDGKRLATTGWDRIVQIYALDLPELINLARERVTRDLDPDECKRYFQTKSCPSLQ
jgi:WD40 repeat protein